MTDTMAEPLEKDFEYFISHHSELVQKYEGKYVVIKDQQVIASYDDEVKAIQETTKTFPLGTFLVQHCTPGTEGYTQVFHSRVAFA